MLLPNSSPRFLTRREIARDPFDTTLTITGTKMTEEAPAIERDEPSREQQLLVFVKERMIYRPSRRTDGASSSKENCPMVVNLPVLRHFDPAVQRPGLNTSFLGLDDILGSNVLGVPGRVAMAQALAVPSDWNKDIPQGVFQGMKHLRTSLDVPRIFVYAAPMDQYRQCTSTGYQAQIVWQEGCEFVVEGQAIWSISTASAKPKADLRLYDPILPPLRRSVGYPSASTVEGRIEWRGRVTAERVFRSWALDLWLESTMHLLNPRFITSASCPQHRLELQSTERI